MIALVILFLSPAIKALETDQFTTPPRPLEDFGPALRAHLVTRIARTIDAANAERQKLLRDADNAPLGVMRKLLTDRANEVLTYDYIAERLYDDIAPGLPECVIEQWTVQETARAGYQFAIKPDDSVYGNFFQRPLTLQELSPTINVYGVYIGTDKIGHFFQQGFEYYRGFRDEEKRGLTPEQATREAVKIGVWQEHGFYGETMVGVYSNADLATNFAGFQFYLNLTRTMEIRGKVRPAILVINNERWEFNPKMDEQFLSVFFSDHMNESMNTCRYMWYVRNHVRMSAAQRGSRWAEFYHTTYEQQARHSRELLTWFGQDYGHCGMEGVFTAAEVCFTQQARQQGAIASIPHQ